MIDKDILEGLSELDEADLKRIKLLVDNKLKIEPKLLTLFFHLFQFSIAS